MRDFFGAVRVAADVEHRQQPVIAQPVFGGDIRTSGLERDREAGYDPCQIPASGVKHGLEDIGVAVSR
jgi:hypothetical protein